MKTKRLLALPVAAMAFVPLTALAEGGQDDSRLWLDSLQSSRSVQEVRAEIPQRLPQHGDLHPVEITVASEAMRTRDEVRAELAEYGKGIAGA